MRIYEGAPRRDWEEVLRSLGAFADAEDLSEILILELPDRILLQGLGLVAAADDDLLGTLRKRSHEFDDDGIAQLIDARATRRGLRPSDRPDVAKYDRDRAEGGALPSVDLTNYYEQALRVVGRYVDEQQPRDVFLFEQDGNFVVRLLQSRPGGRTKHELAEFTRDDILSIIERAPWERDGDDR